MSGNLARRSFLITLAAASVLLLVIGVPRFIAELMLVPGGEIYERLTYSKPVTDEELALLAKTRLRSLEFAEKPHVAGQLATVYAIQATRAKIAEEQRILWARSVEYAERSLALNPLDGFTWFRLAQGYRAVEGVGTDKALEAWRNSIKAGEFLPRLLLGRVHFAVAVFDQLDEKDKAMVQAQLQMAYNHDKEALKTYAQSYGLLDWFRYLGRDNPELLAYLAG